MSNPYEPDPADGASGRPDPYQQPGSTPYGQPYGQPSGQEPPGQPYGASPYGQNPYGQTPYGGDSSQVGKKTDAVSIIAFVLSLTCCLSVVGAIMGFVGLGRTKQGRRKGRWAAIAALVIGILGTLAFAGIIIGVVFLAKTVVTPGNATAGECVDVSQSSGDDNTYSLIKRGCTGTHDAEIVYVGTVDQDARLQETAVDAKDICTGLMGSDQAAKADGDYDWKILLNNPTDPAPTDKFICFVQSSSGGTLDSPILGS